MHIDVLGGVAAGFLAACFLLWFPAYLRSRADEARRRLYADLRIVILGTDDYDDPESSLLRQAIEYRCRSEIEAYADGDAKPTRPEFPTNVVR